MAYQVFFTQLNHDVSQVGSNYTFSVRLQDNDRYGEWHDYTYTLTDQDICYWLMYSIKDSNNNVINNIIEKNITYTITLTDVAGGTYSIDIPEDENITFIDNGNGTFNLTVNTNFNNHLIPLTFKAVKNNVEVKHNKNLYVKEIKALEPMDYNVTVTEIGTITPVDIKVVIEKTSLLIDYIVTELSI